MVIYEFLEEYVIQFYREPVIELWYWQRYASYYCMPQAECCLLVTAICCINQYTAATHTLNGDLILHNHLLIVWHSKFRIKSKFIIEKEDMIYSCTVYLNAFKFPLEISQHFEMTRRLFPRWLLIKKILRKHLMISLSNQLSFMFPTTWYAIFIPRLRSKEGLFDWLYVGLYFVSGRYLGNQIVFILYTHIH